MNAAKKVAKKRLIRKELERQVGPGVDQDRLGLTISYMVIGRSGKTIRALHRALGLV